jgi:tetratricopeptide (TPR) repeat protein
MDADDMMFPQRVTKTVEAFKKNPQNCIVFSNYLKIDAKRKQIGVGPKLSQKLNQKNILLSEVKRNYILGTTLSLKKEVAKNYKYDENLRTSEDYDLFLRLIYDDYKFHYINEPLVKYRLHSSNKSANASRTFESTRYILDKYDFRGLYKKLKDNNCDDRKIFNAFAVVCLLKRDYKKAEEYIGQAMKIRTNNKADKFESLFYAGVINYKLDNLDKSHNYFNKAKEESNKEPTVLNNLGVVSYQINKRAGKVIEKFEKALSIQPNYKDAQYNLKQMNNEYIPDKLTEKILRNSLVHENNYEL